MTIGIVAVVVIAAIIAAFFLGRSSSPSPTGVTTATTVRTATPTQTQTVVTVTVPGQTITTASPPAPPEITEQSVNPSSVSRGGPIAITVRTKGDVVSVVMRISGPAAPGDIGLNQGPTVNGITTWAIAGQAPNAAGLYHYAAVATASNGSTVTAPQSTFTVVP